MILKSMISLPNFSANPKRAKVILVKLRHKLSMKSLKLNLNPKLKKLKMKLRSLKMLKRQRQDLKLFADCLDLRTRVMVFLKN